MGGEAERGVVSRDWSWMFGAYTVSALGSGIGQGALPLVAVLVLHASAVGVAVLAAVSGAVAALVLLAFAPLVERHSKRSTMLIGDLLRFAVLGSVPLAALFGWLGLTQLCLVAMVSSAATIAFGAASGARVKHLRTPGQRLQANSRMSTVGWLSQSAGPAIGGLLISAVGATATMAVDSFSYLLSAVGLWQMRRETPPICQAPPSRVSWHQVVAGWSAIRESSELSRLLVNSLLFGGSVTMISPLLAILMLRDLHYQPWEYGLCLGLPCVGGVIGSRLAPLVARRFGSVKVPRMMGVLRTPWEVALIFVPGGTTGLLMILGAEFLLLLSAGVFNPTFVTRRLELTDDRVLARVLTSWSVSSKLVQSLFTVSGGLLAAMFGVRVGIAVGALFCVCSALVLPGAEQRRAPEADPVLTPTTSGGGL